MKTLLISAAAAITLSGPVFADSVADYAIQHFAQTENGDGARLRSTGYEGGDFVAAYRHFDQSNTGGRAQIDADATGMIVSTSNSDLASIAAAKLDTNERGDN